MLKITGEELLRVALAHFDTKEKFYETALAPRCERWFTTELIAALFSAEGLPYPHYRVYGEEAYATICTEHLGEPTTDFQTRVAKQDRPKRPDITIINVQENKVELVVEVKMVYTASDDALTDDDGQLIDQLKRAARVFPRAIVLGMVFALYQPETGEDLSPAERAADRMLAAVRAFRTKAKKAGGRASSDSTTLRAQALLTLMKGETDRAIKEIEADFRTLECDLEISINNADEEQREGSSRQLDRFLEQTGLPKDIETAVISSEIEQKLGIAPLDVGLSEEEMHIRDAMQSNDRGIDPGVLYDRITDLAKNQMKDQGWTWVEGGVKPVQNLQRIGPVFVSDLEDTPEGERRSEGGIIIPRSISATNKVSARNTTGSVSLGIGDPGALLSLNFGRF